MQGSILTAIIAVEKCQVHCHWSVKCRSRVSDHGVCSKSV